MTDYRVDLDIFAGPLDLLLYLVRKDEVEIYDIPIARVTEQYLQYIDILKTLDMDLAGDFLVMATTLMEIKSAMLLPRAETEGEESDGIGDPRSELIRQLLEYKKFKDAANLLEGSFGRQSQRIGRPNNIIEKLDGEKEPEVDIDQINIWDLLGAFDSIMQATGRLVDISHIKDDTPIDLYQIEILHRLQTEGPTEFERVFQGRTNRLEMVGLFLALLELVRSKLVWVEQPKSSKAIFLRALTEEPAEQAVQKALIDISEDQDVENQQQTAQNQSVITEKTPSSDQESEPAQ